MMMITSVYRSFVRHQEVVMLLTLQVFTLATTGNNLYVSKAHGYDSNNSCQNITTPCQTLRHVIKQAKGNDIIMLEANTEKTPYDTCPNWTISEKLSFRSWNGTAVINCSGNGLTFKARNSTTVGFEGLKFLETFLRIDDISLIITNCSFGSFTKNTAFLFLIHVSVVNPLENLRINIASTRFLERNTAGSLQVVNNQTTPIYVEVRNVTISNNHFKTNHAIFIQGHVNFSFMHSEISYSTFSKELLQRSLVYFRGCIDADSNIDSQISVGRSQDRIEERGSPNFDDDSRIIAFHLEGLIFSYNHAGTIQTAFCISGQVVIINTVVFNNTNRWLSNGAVAIDTIHKENSSSLDVLVKNCSFVSNLNYETGPIVTVTSQNTNLLVTNCSFSRNQGGAVYVATSRSSKVTVRNSTIQFSSSSKPAVMSHCGSQICVIFRKSDSALWNARNNAFDCPMTGVARSGKLRRDGVSNSKEGLSLETNINVITKPRNINGSLETKYCGVGVNCTSGKPLDGRAKTKKIVNVSSMRGSPLKQNVTGTLKTQIGVLGSKNRFLDTARPLNLDDNRPFKMSKIRHGFESKTGRPLERKVRNSKLPKVALFEYGETFDSGILVEDCNFYNNTGWFYSSGAMEVHSEPYISLGEDSLAQVQVRRSKFIGNLATDGTGAIYVAMDGGFNISDSIFRNNAGSESGAIYFTGSTMVIQNCTLDSNSGGYTVLTQATGSVRLTKNGTALIQDSRIVQRNVAETVSKMGTYYSSLAVSSNAFDKIVLSNSVLSYLWSPSLEKTIVLEIASTKRFELKQGSSIQCPIGYNIKRHFVRNTETEQSFQCILCAMGSYSVDRGIYRYNRTYPVECLLCPYGARCIKGLEVLPNFWGYKIHNNPPTIHFSRCPKGYCCQADGKGKSCVPYWSCNTGRHGRLCGECKPGFTETLFTPSCRKSEKCKDYWFWPMAVIFVLVFSLYLIIQPDIPAILYRSITWFRSTPSQAAERDEPTKSGLERIVFFYYQAIDILYVQSSNSTLWNDHLTQFTVGIFNFDMRLNREGFACPFPGLTPVLKLLFQTLGVFSVLFAIPFIFLLHKAVSVCFPVLALKNGPYLSAFLKSVFLGYTVLARKSLTLLHCVDVAGVNCLFINCNTQCYTWWQMLIGTLVLVFFFPFVLVLFFGSKKLYKKQITIAHFFLSCLFPLPFLSYWFLNRRHLGEQRVPDTGGLTAITSLLIGSFRVPDHVSSGAIWWESILIGRMLVLILAAVLIKDPFLSSLTLLFFCVFNLSLHIHVRPFERVVDNRAEIISLFSLVLMAIFNLPYVAYLSEGVVPTGPMSNVMDVFSWCQFVLVGFLPFIGVLLVFVALFSQAVRLMCFFSKGFRSACSCFASHRIFGQNQQDGELDDPLVG